MSGHTTGPWVARKHGVIVGGPFHQFDGGKAQRQVAMACVISESEGAEEERDANARLISAALDMAEALRKAREFVANVGCEIDSALLIQIDAALTKAGANE